VYEGGQVFWRGRIWASFRCNGICAPGVECSSFRSRQDNHDVPAPPDLPNVTAFQIAQYEHYYSDSGLDAEFLAGKGGVDAARQVGAGNVDFAEVFGDTEIVVRSEGLPVKMVALMGWGEGQLF
jgi:NitT/TauT family transport system substrate-binding protein